MSSKPYVMSQYKPEDAATEWTELDEVTKEGFTTNDQLDMQRMGKKQEFRRNFRFLTTVGFTCCVMGTWEILLTSNTPALLAGGSAGLFWSVCWAYCGQFFVVLSLAEMSSMAPTAGAQYHWISLLAPAEYQRLLSYLSGWLSTISWQSIVALDCYLVGTIIQGLITVNDETYVAAKWQATLLIITVAIFITPFNIFAAKHLPLAEGIFVTGHFFAFFPVVIILLVLAPKRSTKDVFLTFSDNGAGWPNVGLSTLVGQVSAIFSVLGSDSVAHMAEEVQDSSIVVPRAMTWSFIVNIPSTIGLLLTYLYCMPSVSDAVSHSSGYPFLYVFQEATGSASGATGLAIVILLLLAMITISAAASTSRQTFAFARDHGLPFSTWLSTVHPRWHVPANAIVFTCIFTIVLSLINIGSTAAFNAMLSLSATALMTTYV
ncbi:hypothetical protein LTR64_001994 [Lithohypha guttulata]|uniref:uncharacterized protein n=1 Tax=Lithohypha guttulata TaxID=1690604 RepID=UPI002DDED534|nr:hypothetical protein LTR51_007853 [Lithohypha guttulata]